MQGISSRKLSIILNSCSFSIQQHAASYWVHSIFHLLSIFNAICSTTLSFYFIFCFSYLNRFLMVSGIQACPLKPFPSIMLGWILKIQTEPSFSCLKCFTNIQTASRMFLSFLAMVNKITSCSSLTSQMCQIWPHGLLLKFSVHSHFWAPLEMLIFKPRIRFPYIYKEILSCQRLGNTMIVWIYI